MTEPVDNKPKILSTKNLPVDEFITFDDFIKNYHSLSSSERKYYRGNFADNELRTDGEWKAITGLK